MVKLSTVKRNGRTVEFFESKQGSIEVICLIGNNVSRAFGPKQYKTINAAQKYSNKFLGPL